MNKLFQHFPLDSIHPIARKKAESIECIADLTGNPDKLYELVERNFKEGLAIFDFEDILADNGILEDNFDACVDSSEIKQRVENQLQRGINVFGVNATPTSVLLNTTTGEYEIVR